MDDNFKLDGYSFIYADPHKCGAILREQRVTQNMTQRQVALRAGVTIRQYQNFESDARNIRTASFILTCRILEALNMDIARFYHGEYAIGEETYTGDDGKLHYKKTGRGVDEDVTEENPEQDPK